MLQADRVNPIRRTISEYALGEDGWMFDVGVIGLAVGSLLVLFALVGAGLLGRARPAARWPWPTWSATLLVVVAFEKTNWSIGPSVGGYIHRYASLAAFLALPVAALALGRRWRRRPAVRPVRRVDVASLGVVSLGWLSTIFLGVFAAPADRRAVVAVRAARAGRARAGRHRGGRRRDDGRLGLARRHPRTG